jgi:transcription antitermination protein NusB
VATRREARERALELLYEAEMKAQPVTALLADLPVQPDPLSAAIAEGVQSEVRDLDAQIARHLRSDWRLDRLPLLDLLVLRIGLWELMNGDAPRAVVLTEAVELAKRYAGEESGRFVNGLLAAAAPG